MSGALLRSASVPESTRAIPPQALGEDMEVPFISCVPRSVQLGTEAMAPPGALMLTPRAPSVLGPRDDHVYWFGGSFSLSEYSATIMSGVTYAPTPAHQEPLNQCFLTGQTNNSCLQYNYTHPGIKCICGGDRLHACRDTVMLE